MHNIYVYILVMAGVSFLLRVLPLTLIRKPIKNRFIRSCLHYIPYITLALMTFPAIIETTAQPLAGVAALVVGIIMAWLNFGCFPVAVACCVVALIVQTLL